MANPNAPRPADDDIGDWINRVKAFVNQPSTVTAAKPGRNAWSTSFFGCLTPVDTCCITCCCPCVTFGKTHHRLRKDPNLAGYSPINASCIGWFASNYFCLGWLPMVLQRHDINERFNLEGDFPVDCLKAWCCGCCELIQQDKEAEYHLAHQVPLAQQPGLKEGMQMPQGPVTPATA
ncbi:PLAC8 family-domain-containing protein [Xylogone sp. PMI_703]|nr:PLAC8 family-domain-containing protein [Xylogone sp. PMI_703]